MSLIISSASTAYKSAKKTTTILPASDTSTISNVNVGYEYLLSATSAIGRLAFAFRKLNPNYFGPCVNLRRSSDNATADFGFVNNILDTNAISLWLGGSNAFVTAWYDQSGNGFHLTQTTSASQPQFFLTDPLTLSFPCIYIGGGSGQFLQNTNVSMNGYSEAIVSAMMAPIGSQTSGTNKIDANVIYWAESASWGGLGMAFLSGEFAWRFGTGQTGNSNSITRSPTDNSFRHAMVIKRTASEYLFIDGGSFSVATGKTSPTANIGTTVKMGGGDGGNTENTKICELVIFVSAPVGCETIISKNVSRYYTTALPTNSVLNALVNGEVRTYYNNVITNGGTVSSYSLQAIDSLVTDLKNLNLWTKLDDFGIFCGDQLAAALTKLKYSQGLPWLVNHNFVEADFIERGPTGGLKGNGSNKYLDTGHSGGLVGQITSLSQSVYFNGTAGGCEIGEDSTNRFTLFCSTPSVAIASGGVYSPGRSIAGGLLIGSRIPGSNVSASINGDFSTWGTADNASISNFTCHVFARNENGTAVTFTSNRICSYHIGTGLTSTDCGNLYNVLQKFHRKFGRQFGT